MMDALLELLDVADQARKNRERIFRTPNQDMRALGAADYRMDQADRAVVNHLINRYGQLKRIAVRAALLEEERSQLADDWEEVEEGSEEDYANAAMKLEDEGRHLDLVSAELFADLIQQLGDKT